MALFGTKKNTPSSAKASEGKEKGGPVLRSFSEARDLSHILSHARITEKATMSQGAKVYAFNISSRATKRDIIRAIYQIYKVTPRAVRVVTVPTKPIRHAKTGKTGIKGGGKKAYVYLKSGESIIIS